MNSGLLVARRVCARQLYPMIPPTLSFSLCPLPPSNLNRPFSRYRDIKRRNKTHIMFRNNK